MKIIAIIPARKGSKGIPNKNIKYICGKPLIAYSIEVALNSELIDDVYVSTDSEQIAKISKDYGAKVIKRPSYLAQDKSQTFDAIEHALKWIQKNKKYKPDLIVILEPPSPTRKANEIDLAIEMLLNDLEADSLRGVCEPFQNPYKMWTIEGKYLKPLLKPTTHKQPRQSLPKVYWQNGHIYVTRYKTIKEHKSIEGKKILPFIFERTRYVDLDEPEDIDVFEFKLRMFINEK